MKRIIEEDLKKWKDKQNRLPILLRGARQVGKTYIVDDFGTKSFEKYVKIDFEQTPEACRFFDSLDPKKIISTLEPALQQKMIPGRTLLFLDEIQNCPNAIMALRYFKEQMPELHVIGAGSLLEFALNDPNFRMPVGRVQYLFLKPLTFQEFLLANQQEIFLERLKNTTVQDPLPEVLHQHALQLFKQYMVLGGMPAVIQEYINTNSYLDCQKIQSALLATYRDDFGKYAKFTQHKTLQILFERIPGLIARWFKYSKIDPLLDPRTIRLSLDYLTQAGLITPIYATSTSGLPLIASVNRKKFKLIFLDIGLVNRGSHLDISLLLREDLTLINQGALIEQYVGQEMQVRSDCHELRDLFFWVREKKGSSAEIDFVTQVDHRIIPIEVKAGATGRLKSLKLFMEEKKVSLGVRISQNPLSFESGILSIPLYLVSELPRLVNAMKN